MIRTVLLGVILTFIGTSCLSEQDSTFPSCSLPTWNAENKDIKYEGKWYLTWQHISQDFQRATSKCLIGTAIKDSKNATSWPSTFQYINRTTGQPNEFTFSGWSPSEHSGIYNYLAPYGYTKTGIICGDEPKSGEERIIAIVGCGPEDKSDRSVWIGLETRYNSTVGPSQRLLNKVIECLSRNNIAVTSLDLIDHDNCSN